jgi:hypothetical protein
MFAPQTRARASTHQFALSFALAALLISGRTDVAAVIICDAEPWLPTLSATGEQIVIDGTCSSACTLVLGIVPHDRICVTSNAVLGFHAAWRPGFLGVAVINNPGTQTLQTEFGIGSAVTAAVSVQVALAPCGGPVLNTVR